MHTRKAGCRLPAIGLFAILAVLFTVAGRNASGGEPDFPGLFETPLEEITNSEGLRAAKWLVREFESVAWQPDAMLGSAEFDRRRLVGIARRARHPLTWRLGGLGLSGPEPII